MKQVDSAPRNRILVTHLVALAVATASAYPARGEAERPNPPALPVVADVGLTVSDLDRATAFYAEVLTFELLDERECGGEAFAQTQGLPGARARTARLRLGEEVIELTEYLTPRGRPFPADSRANDGWFQHIAIIVSDMERAHERLHEWMVRHASMDPQRLPDWNRNAAGIEAFYFRDPDGHYLELLKFPTDKGDPKWHRPTDRLLLGIDHTAIVVADTDASLHLYRDLLGMQVVGSSENYGPEQEALNNVRGAHLRITTLRGASGPGIELLEYLSPRNGRPYPRDARPNDLLHWQTTVRVSDAAALTGALQRNSYRFVTPGIGVAGLTPSSERRAALVRDADGHALRIVMD